MIGTDCGMFGYSNLHIGIAATIPTLYDDGNKDASIDLDAALHQWLRSCTKTGYARGFMRPNDTKIRVQGCAEAIENRCEGHKSTHSSYIRAKWSTLVKLAC